MLAKRSLNEVPGPQHLPWLGAARALAPDRIHSVLESWADEFGSPYAFTLAGQRVLVFSDETRVLEVLRARPRTFRRLRQIESVLGELDALGVFAAEGEVWKRQRKLMLFAFGPRPLEALFPKFRRTTERLLGRLAEGGARPILNDLTRFTVDITIEVIFGRDSNTLEQGSDALQRSLEFIFAMVNRRVIAPIPYWRWLRLPEDRRLERTVTEVGARFRQMIAETRAELAQDANREARPTTILEAMIAARDEEDPDRRLTDDEIYANVITLMLAGEDTTANAMAWMLSYLAERPDVAGRLREEADRVLGAGPVLARFEQLHQLPYTSAVIHETLRLKSPAPILFLEALEDTTVGDVPIPVGTPVFVLTRHAETHGPRFEDPMAFRPERWLAPSGDGLIPEANRVLAFGAGPRICPGRPLALLESALVATAVAKGFQVEAVTLERPREKFQFVMQPDGLRLRFTPR